MEAHTWFSYRMGFFGLGDWRFFRLNGSQRVTDLTPIAELTNLTRLSLANLKELRDLSPLAGLKGLKYLDLVNSTNITKQQINSIRKALPNCRIVDPYHYHWRRSG